MAVLTPGGALSNGDCVGPDLGVRVGLNVGTEVELHRCCVGEIVLIVLHRSFGSIIIYVYTYPVVSWVSVFFDFALAVFALLDFLLWSLSPFPERS